jgi:tetratricopeptide (TPR) repeat protein
MTTCPTPPPAAKDRVVRVFVSSTFRDMVEDRNELMAHVWPTLRKVCREGAVEFVEVDLRWGVTEEQSQRQETLRHCLAEIRRCRPYFIGLLGERYGWVPGPEAYSPTLLDEEGWLGSRVAKHSVTELEILHGVLNAPDVASRSFFYFRDPGYAQAHGGDYPPEAPANAACQGALKQRVRAICQAKHIPLREGYANPRALAALVLADLTAAIDAEFPADRVPDVWTREDRDHEAYAKSRRTEFYVGRASYFNRLDAFARAGAGGCGLTVLGESGAGKSALLANWIAHWRQANPDGFLFQHYIGSSPMSAGHLALMRRLLVAIVRWCGDDGTPDGSGSWEKRIPGQAEEMVKVFPEYLSRLAFRAKERGVRAVLVLDALNQIEDRERGRLLAWIPYRLPGELRLVVSTLPGDTLDAIKPRGWSAFTVEPLIPEERVRLIARYLAHFSQGLSEPRAHRIAAVPAASSPLYLKALLDDLRATGVHDRLDAQIADYLQAADIPALFGKVLARYERDFERDRPELVREALALLWAARRGLTEPELLQALSPAGQERLPAALWSPVRCALADSLVDRDGVLGFAHQYLRQAVERRYVPDPGTARVLRFRLAGAFAGRPIDDRQADELPWLLRQTEDRDRLRTYLLDIDRFLLVHERDEDELRDYWVWLREERAMGKAYMESFEAWSAETNPRDLEMARAADRLGNFLYGAALHAETEALVRRALPTVERIFGPTHLAVATGLSNLGHVLMATNRLAEAEPLFRRALEIHDKRLGPPAPEVTWFLGGLGRLLRRTNRFGEAEALFRRALSIAEQVFGPTHPNVAIRLDDLGGLLEDTNRLAEAEVLLRRALTVIEQALGPEDPCFGASALSLAHLLHVTNRLAEAEVLLRRALAIHEESLGLDHPIVATALCNLAGLLGDTNRLAEAEPLLRRALAIDERSLGSHHPRIAHDLSNLANLCHGTNRLAEAEPLLRRALVIDEHSFGLGHPTVAIRLNNLVALLLATGRLAEAEPVSRRVVEIFLRFTRETGHRHPHLQDAVANYAGLLQAMGCNAKETRRALETLGQEFGVDLGGRAVGKTRNRPPVRPARRTRFPGRLPPGSA